MVLAEEDCALETKPFGEDPGDGRASFFGMVFVVRGDKDEVLAFAGAAVAFIGKDFAGLGEEREAEEGE